jgi:Zn-dependent protease with chaperone function
MRSPRFGIIDDGAPQAFTYGHTPNNARIVISRGTLELLDPREVEAVVAHEIGHAVHWDMALMTLANMVPLILYYLYRSLSRVRGKARGQAALVAAGAYLLYIVSEYVVLWFSRTREYYADRFSGEVTGSPSLLASALVKIAYGLAGQDARVKAEEAEEEIDRAAKPAPRRSPAVDAIGAMGIFDGNTARTLAVAGYSDPLTATGQIDPAQLKGAMRWDLWNPWARWYELNSTHPLVAKRLQYLSNQAAHMGQQPYIVFDEVQPESYWDEFVGDLAVYLLPMATIGATLYLWLVKNGGTQAALWRLLPMALLTLGGAMLLKYHFKYPSGSFPKLRIANLLKYVKVSGVRPVPCELSGTIIGRGIPGYIFSEDFVLKDPTGIVFLDYRQPLGIWEALFGLLRAGGYQGRSVVVRGWYFRSPVPYVQIDTMLCDGETLRSWVPALYRATAWACIIAAIVLFVLPKP